MASYTFDPSNLLPWATIKERLAKVEGNPYLAVIATCGSFNPITTAHIEMIETGKHYLEEKGTAICLGGYISPVGDAYGKKDLAPFVHRKAVCDIALKGHEWVATESWEGTREQYERTFTVLAHIRREVRAHYTATATDDAERLLAGRIELYFLCGGDLFETFYRSGVWDLSLLEKIFVEFRLLVVAREGSQDPLDTIAAHLEPLTHPSTPDASLDLRLYRSRISVIRIGPNTTSSTKVRQALRSGAPLDGMVSSPEVEKYLRDNKVYV